MVPNSHAGAIDALASQLIDLLTAQAAELREYARATAAGEERSNSLALDAEHHWTPHLRPHMVVPNHPLPFAHRSSVGGFHQDGRIVVMRLS